MQKTTFLNRYVPDASPLIARVAKLGAHEVGAIAALLVFVSLVWIFWAIADEVVEGDTHRLDMALLMALRTPGNPRDLLGPPWFEEMMRDFTALGSYAFIILLVTVTALYLLLVRQKALALLTVGSVASGMVVSNFLKMGFDRPRPEIDHAARVFTPSFPSGHAMLSAITFLTIGALLTRASAEWRVKVYLVSVALLMTFIVGASRVYLGVHYPTDVLAGWCVGSAWALLCWAMALWLQRRGQVEPPK